MLSPAGPSHLMMVFTGFSPAMLIPSGSLCDMRSSLSVAVMRYVPAGKYRTRFGDFTLRTAISAAWMAAVSSALPSPTAPKSVFTLAQLRKGPTNSSALHVAARSIVVDTSIASTIIDLLIMVRSPQRVVLQPESFTTQG